MLTFTNFLKGGKMNVYDSHTAINIISDFVYDNFAS